MSRQRVFVALGALLLGLPSTVWAQDPLHKAGRGVVNVLTAWVEVPKNMHLGMEEDNPVLGAAWGIVKGAGLGSVRLVLGAYEAVSFLIPYPKGYASPYEGLELSDYAWD